MIHVYARVSSTKQIDGLSLSLQGDNAMLSQLSEQYQTTVSSDIYRDEGVSSFKGDNLNRGELGRLISDIESGKIASGDIIVIRSLDRLSRQSLTTSEQLYNRIVAADVRIHTTIDNRLYVKDCELSSILKTLSLKLAHEESAKKQYLTNRNALFRVEQFQRGETSNGYAYDVGVGKHPFWAQLDDKVVKPHPVYFECAKSIVRMMLQGDGTHKIIEWLNKHYPCKEWHYSTISAMHRKDTLMGRLNITLEDKKYQLDDFYPALCTEAELYQIRKQKETRTHQRQTDTYSVLSGYERFYCGCGWSVTSINPANKPASYRCTRLPKPCFSYINQRVVNHVALDAIQTHVFVQQEFDSTQLDSLKSERDLLTDKVRKQQSLLIENPDLFDAEFKKAIQINKDELVSLETRIEAEQLNSFQSGLSLDDYAQWQSDILKYSTSTDKDELLHVRGLIAKLVERIELDGQLVTVTMADGQKVFRHIIKNKRHDIQWCKVHVVDSETLHGVEIVNPSLLDVYCTECDLERFTKANDIHPDLSNTIEVTKATDHYQVVSDIVTQAIFDVNVIRWDRKTAMNLGVTTTQWQQFKDSEFEFSIYQVNWKNRHYVKKTSKVACFEFNVDEAKALFGAHSITDYVLV